MDVEHLEKLLADGREGATLRFALGSAYLKQSNERDAIRHLSAAVEMDPLYSAAWKLLGQAQAAIERLDDAYASFSRGIEAATQRGDVQAAREMRVYLKRVEKRRNPPAP